MKRMVIRVEREAMGGVLRARVETNLENFYNLAAADLKVDVADLLRPALREHARKLARTHNRLKRFAHGL